jgi:hypothetical protein
MVCYPPSFEGCDFSGRGDRARLSGRGDLLNHAPAVRPASRWVGSLLGIACMGTASGSIRIIRRMIQPLGQTKGCNRSMLQSSQRDFVPRLGAGQSHRLNRRSWQLVDRCRNGQRSGQLLRPLGFACIERPDRKLAPRQRPSGDWIVVIGSPSQRGPSWVRLPFNFRRPSGMEMPHRSAIARRRSSTNLLRFHGAVVAPVAVVATASRRTGHGALRGKRPCRAFSRARAAMQLARCFSVLAVCPHNSTGEVCFESIGRVPRLPTALSLIH